MSVAGFDFGSQNSRVAIIRSGGVEVICNEVSDRATPSMVSFDAKRRYAGDAARTLQVGNFRNTVINLPRLMGRLYNEALSLNEVNHETCRVVDKGGVCAAAVSYLDQDATFSNIELVAMFLSKLKSISYNETKTPLSDVVISVPSYFGEKERRALADAAEVAGLNCLRTVNDVTAAAVGYGMMKSEIPSDTTKNFVILDIGYASLKASVVSVKKGVVEVKAHVSDPFLGGRDFDECLVNHFINHFIKVRKIDIGENKKALLRLRIACERIKKVLSGIQVTKMDLEALIDGSDFPLEATRALLEELSANVLDRIEKHLLNLLQVSGMKFDDIESVEIIGGSTRIPAIKSRVANLFGRDASTTLNADEAVARGCALLAAIDSPLVRVKEFKVSDVSRYPIVIKSSGVNLVELPAGLPLGQSIKVPLGIQKTTYPISLTACYGDCDLLMGNYPSQVASFTLAPPKSLDVSTIKSSFVEFHLNTSTFLEISDAAVETETIEKPAAVEEGQEQSANPSKVICRTIPLTIKSETFKLPRATIIALKEAEIAMTLRDKMAAELDDARNTVEEFIFEARQKLDDEYSAIITEEEKKSVLKKLRDAEDWLYGDGADVSKDHYVSKLKEMKSHLIPFAEKLKKELRESLEPDSSATPESSSTSGDLESRDKQSPENNHPIMDMD